MSLYGAAVKRHYVVLSIPAGTQYWSTVHRHLSELYIYTYLCIKGFAFGLATEYNFRLTTI
jgi:hypothetical protein